ncbi:MAG: phage major capsid protein [Polynucleobacter sp.]
MSIRVDNLKTEIRGLLESIQVLRSKEKPEESDPVTLRTYLGKLTDAQERLADEERADKAEAEYRQPADSESRGGELPEERKTSLGNFLQAIAGSYGTGPMDKRDAKAMLETRAPSGMSEAVPSDGGFLVGQQQGAMLASKIWDSGNLLGVCKRVPISGPFDGIKYNFIDESSRADGSRSGSVLAYWKNEAAATTASKPKIGESTMNLEKLFALCYVTSELLQDSTGLEAMIMEEFNKEMKFKLLDALFNGTGAGQPIGILNAPATVQVAKEVGQTARTISFENIVNMYAQLFSGASFGSTRWAMNRSCIPQIMSLAIKVGTAGYPLYIPGNSLAGTPNGTLLGVPIEFVEQAQTLGTAGDIYLGDFSQYMIIDKAGVQSASSMHVNFLTDEMAYRFTMRVNGQPTWKNSVTPFKDASTSKKVSPFIALAVRA